MSDLVNIKLKPQDMITPAVFARLVRALHMFLGPAAQERWLNCFIMFRPNCFLYVTQCSCYPLATSPMAIIWPVGRLKLVSGEIFDYKLQPN